MVTHADDEGFLYVLRVGGWRPEVLLGQRVEIVTRGGSVPGVIGRRGRRPLKRGEDFPRLELEELHLDIGARSREDALALVSIGDVAVIAGEPVEVANGRLVSRSLDNRLGAYVALEAARAVAQAGGAPGDFVGVAAVQEEIGDFSGARTSVFALEPQVVLAVDITGATDMPGGDPKIDGEAKLGAGPILNRRSSSCFRRPPRPKGSRTRSTSPRGTRTPTWMRPTSAAPGSRPGSSRSRSATRIRRPSWSRSMTSRPRSSSSRHSPSGSSPGSTSLARVAACPAR